MAILIVNSRRGKHAMRRVNKRKEILPVVLYGCEIWSLTLRKKQKFGCLRINSLERYLELREREREREIEREREREREREITREWW